MNIDLGWLGKVMLEEIHIPYPVQGETFEVTHDGYTESGIRIHGVRDMNSWVTYPRVWNNAIMINMTWLYEQ